MIARLDQAAGGIIHAADAAWSEQVDIIIDTLLGTGLNRAPVALYDRLITQTNAHAASVLAVDIPSGLVAANGTTLGTAIVADRTLSMIALKPGQLTGKARDHVGHLQRDELGLSTFPGRRNNAHPPL